MNRGMEEEVGNLSDELLYEIKRHSSGSCTSNYPPQSSKERQVGGIASRPLNWIREIVNIKKRWSNQNNLVKVTKTLSMFISVNGYYVAIASGNKITILQKEDDYEQPCGVFMCDIMAFFTSGAWSERHDILGVCDVYDTLFFIKPNGEEITRIPKRLLTLSGSILGVIPMAETLSNKSSLCAFIVLSQDGYQILDISGGPNVSIPCMQSDNFFFPRKTFPANVFCFDHNSKQDLLVFVGGLTDKSGRVDGNFDSSSLFLCHLDKNSDQKVLSSIHFRGLYLQSNDPADSPVHPKVVISPSCSLVATLDILGILHIFQISEDCMSLSNITQRDEVSLSDCRISTDWADIVRDIADFTWWSDSILAVAHRTGKIIMLNVLTGKSLQEDSLLCSNFVMDKAKLLQGCIFFLEVAVSDKLCLPSSVYKESDIVTSEISSNPSGLSGSHWSLFSISSRSVSEMYQMLIRKLKFSEALDFASCHGLDQDEILKAQWLHSPRGVNDVNMYLSNIRDQAFVVSECLENIGPTEDAANAILALGLLVTNQYRSIDTQEIKSDMNGQFFMNRLRLLQFMDRLETYLGINMGRFSIAEYTEFRVMPLSETALKLAEKGKLGALNLLFKRHPFSLSLCLLEVLASIPETIDVQTYEQLLPGKSPSGIILREVDWVECDPVINYIFEFHGNREIDSQMRTELVVKKLYGCSWPSSEEISTWYKDRAFEIDRCSGQVDNCFYLLDFACSKGFQELQKFREDVFYLNKLLYANEDSDLICCHMNLTAWEQLSDYEKFRVMLQNVTVYNIVKRLKYQAIPFMKNRQQSLIRDNYDHQMMDDRNLGESFLVRWLKDLASENKLDLCLIAIEEGCNELEETGFFNDDNEVIDCALQCIYLCSLTDKWNTMASMLSKLPQSHDVKREPGSVEKRFKAVEGHIEAGRLLAFYQVPKPINFLLEAHNDEKGAKQTLRLILSKFVRRQPSRPDTDWANLWRDLQSLREKAFSFLDSEFMLMEFCRGLLKTGKFSLARNYLRGTGSVTLTPEKAENLVIQSARDYFFSASTLSCTEIWMAKECLNIFPNNSNVKAEIDVIDALTIKLPDLGVSLLPMQFRQIKNPMEVINLAIASQAEAYLRVDDLIDVAKLLGMRSSYEISVVEEAIAREAAVAGDLQLAFDLCLNLARKGHGIIWDLCAALARGPALENMNINSRKHLLGFALSYCDEESVGELLLAWKDLDMQGRCDSLVSLRGINYNDWQAMYEPRSSSERMEGVPSDDADADRHTMKRTLDMVTESMLPGNGSDLESLFQRNKKFKSFGTFQLPWLIDVYKKTTTNDKQIYVEGHSSKLHLNLQAQASLTILSWLAQYGLTPKDDLIALLAKSIIDSPVTEQEDLEGCLFLLNLVDAFNGVKVIEDQLHLRTNYQEICSVMKMGMIYSSLHESGFDCEDPAQRRCLLLKKFGEKHIQLTSDEVQSLEKTQTTFWRNWKIHLEEKKQLAERSKMVEEVIPGVEIARFLSGDSKYIETTIFALIDSLKFNKKHIVKEALKLADTYGVPRNEVLQRFLCAILVSEAWSAEDIMGEIMGFRSDIVIDPYETIETMSIAVYPEIDGRDKTRLAIIFSILSDCYIILDKTKGTLSSTKPYNMAISSLPHWARFYKVLEQECRRISFMQSLNFKNIAGLNGLNEECFKHEVYSHTNECSLETLATMVQELSTICPDPVPDGLLSWQDVYKHYLMSIFATYELKAQAELNKGSVITSEKFQEYVTLLEQNFYAVQIYFRLLSPSDAIDIMKHYCTVVISVHGSALNIVDDSTWQDCLIFLLKFWIILMEEMEKMALQTGDKLLFDPILFSAYLKNIMHLVVEDRISPNQCWFTIMEFFSHCFINKTPVEVHSFCRAMVLSGCSFGAVSEVFSQTLLKFGTGCTMDGLPHLYLSILESILDNLNYESSDHQKLFNMLSSLSKIEDTLDHFQRARQIVWERLAHFSGDLQLPGQVRVFVLEVMQCITGKNIKGFSHQRESNILVWEGWDEILSIGKINETTSNRASHDGLGTSTEFTSTLVALRSSQVVASISSNIEITSNDLSNVDAAVACFMKFCKDCQTSTHIHSLLALLNEWDGIFLPGGADDCAPVEDSEVANDWSNDWDGEWDNSPDEEVHGKEKALNNHIHPLHICWFETFKCLIRLSFLNEAIKVADISLTKPGVTLLDEQEVRIIILDALEKDCVVACKFALLFPYKSVHLYCFDALEKQLKEGVGPEKSMEAHDFLILLLSSGFISTIITEAPYKTTFSFICYLIGHLSRQCQEYSWTRHNKLRSQEDAKNPCFRRIVLPAFLSELVKADRHILAGYLIAKLMHTNSAFSLIHVTVPSLCKYLKLQKQELETSDLSPENIGTFDLMNSYVRLKERLGDLMNVALNMLS